jgi:hypothetical protein
MWPDSWTPSGSIVFLYNFLFKYMIRKIDTHKIKNKLNIEVFVWDRDKPINIKQKQIMMLSQSI